MAVYLKDKVAGILFTDEDTRGYTVKVMSKVLEIDEQEIRDNLRLITPRVNENINTKYSELDAVYENNTMIINIEINMHYSKYLHQKNQRYVYQLNLKQIKAGEKELKHKTVYQININYYDIFKHKEFIYTSQMMEIRYHDLRDKNSKIIDINLEYLEQFSYNDIISKFERESLERLLYIFVTDDIEIIRELSKGDNIMAEVEKKLSALTEDFYNELYYDREELLESYSYEKGISDGVKIEKVEIAKNLLSMNVSDEDIMKATGLSQEEVEKLKEK